MHFAVLVNYILVFFLKILPHVVGVIGLDFTFYVNPAHHTVSLATILERNNNHMGTIEFLSPSV